MDAHGVEKAIITIATGHPIDAMVAQAAVQRAAFGPAEVQRADCLGAALAAANSGEFHLVLLDLNMADSRGLATLERMLGEETMARVMRTYHERWRFRHPGSRDFYAVASEVAGRDGRPCS